MHCLNKGRLCIQLAMMLAGSALAGSALAQTEAAPPPDAQPTPEPTPEPASTPTVDDHIRALGALDVSARVTAAQALGQLRAPEAVSPLARALRSDPNPVVRGWIVRALGQINLAEAQAAITAAGRTDADERVRSLALQLVPQAAPAPAQTPTYSAPAQQPLREHRRDPGHALRGAGWGLFGGSYGFALLLGVIFMTMESEIAWPMFIPVVGPLINAARALREGYDVNIIAAVFGILSMMVQTGGMSMAIVGHVRRRRSQNQETTTARPRRSFALVPAGPAGGPGLTFSAQF